MAAAAELALAARVARVRRAQVRAALWDARTLAKTWTVRGTLHLHPADELSTWLAARRGTREWTEGRWRAREGLSEREAGRLMDAIADALDGRSLTRTALADEVRRRAGSRIADRIGSGWAHLLGPARPRASSATGRRRGAETPPARPARGSGTRVAAPPRRLRRRRPSSPSCSATSKRCWFVAPCDAQIAVEPLLSLRTSS